MADVVERVSVYFFVKDHMGNIQAGHKSAEEAMRHASHSPRLRAYESRTVTRWLRTQATQEGEDV